MPTVQEHEHRLKEVSKEKERVSGRLEIDEERGEREASDQLSKR